MKPSSRLPEYDPLIIAKKAKPTLRMQPGGPLSRPVALTDSGPCALCLQHALPFPPCQDLVCSWESGWDGWGGPIQLELVHAALSPAPVDTLDTGSPREEPILDIPLEAPVSQIRLRTEVALRA